MRQRQAHIWPQVGAVGTNKMLGVVLSRSEVKSHHKTDRSCNVSTHNAPRIELLCIMPLRDIQTLEKIGIFEAQIFIELFIDILLTVMNCSRT